MGRIIMMNGLVVIQNGQFYSIYTPQGIQIAQIFTGADGQIIQDVLALKEITQALKKRWNVQERKNKSGS